MIDMLCWSEVAPEIRGANYIDAEVIHLGPRHNYAYQMLYVFKGSGVAEICGESFSLGTGFLALYGPGDKHEFRSSDNSPMSIGTVNFSWRREEARRLVMGNRAVAVRPPDFLEFADPRFAVEGLPPIPFIVSIPKTVRARFERLLRETGSSFRKAGDPLLILSYKAALLEMIRLLVQIFRDSDGSGGHPSIKAFRSFIQESYAESITRADAAGAAGISESRLTALLRKELGTNFTEFLTQVRMEAALELLQFSRMSGKETALRCGFRDYSYFVSRFRRRYGCPPGKWRNN